MPGCRSPGEERHGQDLVSREGGEVSEATETKNGVIKSSRLFAASVEMTDWYFIWPSFGEVPTLSFSLWLVKS